MIATAKLNRLIITAVLSVASVGSVYAATEQGAEATASIQSAAPDDAINQKLKAALAGHDGVQAIAVQSVVTLTGQVASEEETAKVVALVAAVEGVKEVKSELKVAAK